MMNRKALSYNTSTKKEFTDSRKKASFKKERIKKCAKAKYKED
jgi:hypothetical protein